MSVINSTNDQTQIIAFLYTIFHKIYSPNKHYVISIILPIIQNLQFLKREYSTLYCTYILLKVSPTAFLRFIKLKCESPKFNQDDAKNIINLIILLFYTISEFKINFKHQRFFEIINHYYKQISSKFPNLDLSQPNFFIIIYHTNQYNFFENCTTTDFSVISRILYYKLRYNILYDVENHVDIENYRRLTNSLTKSKEHDLFLYI